MKFLLTEAFCWVRYKEGHAIRHWKDAHHSYSLDLEKQQVWDYVGDSFVHRLNQSKADDKMAMMDSHCMLTDGDCGTYGGTDDSGISGALFSSKVEAVYHFLFPNNLTLSST